MKNPIRAVVGSSLVEVTLALGLAGFALVALFGLLPVGLNNNRSAIQQTNAANLLTDIVADLRSASTTATQSSRFGINLNNSSTIFLDEEGGPFPAATAATNSSRYRVTLTVTTPTAGQRLATIVGLVVSWPATVAAANAAGQVSTVVALDRN